MCRLTITLTAGKRARDPVGTVEWLGDDTPMLPPSTQVRAGLRVLWRTDGPEVVVTVDYETLGRAQIRATVVHLSEWTLNSELQGNVRRLDENPEA